MKELSSRGAVARPPRVSAAAAAAVAAAGGIVALGWICDIDVLKGPIPGGATMKLNTALSFTMVGVSLGLRLSHGRDRRVANGLAAGAALVGLASLSEYVFGWNLRIDELFVSDTASISAPGRMSPITAVCFTLFGTGLLAMASDRTAWSKEALAIAGGLLGAIATIGYLFDIGALYGTPYTSMAVHTAVLMCLIAAGLLWAPPPGPVMRIVLSEGAAGTSGRWLLAFAFTIPVLLGWLSLRGERLGLFGAEFGFAVLVAVMVLLTAVVIVRSTWGLLEADARQRAAANRLRDAHDTLELEVAARTKALSRSERELRLVIDRSHDAFVAMDVDDIVLDWNPRAEVIFGWSKGEALGRHLAELILPDRLREGHSQALRQFVASGEGALDSRTELMAIRHSGGEFPIELTISPVYADDTWRFNAFVRDLTEARASERRFRSLLESAPDAMVIVDAHGTIQLVNAQAERLFGYTRAEMLGQPVELLIPARSRRRHVAQRADYAAEPLARAMGVGRQLTGRRKDGSEFPVEISLSPLETAAGTLVSSAIRDITASVAAKRQLESSLVEKELLLSEIHHRVKNNLQVVSSLLNLQQEALGSDEARGALRDSRARVQAMALLHEKLYQRGQLTELDLTSYVKSLWQHVVRTMAPPDLPMPALLIDAGGPTLDLDTAVPCALILTELFTNSVKHAFRNGRRGTVSVTSSRLDDGCLRLHVSDDGVGFTEADREQARRCGSIGLKLIEALAAQLGGTCAWLDQHGTSFALTLPARRPSTTEPTP